MTKLFCFHSSWDKFFIAFLAFHTICQILSQLRPQIIQLTISFCIIKICQDSSRKVSYDLAQFSMPKSSQLNSLSHSYSMSATIELPFASTHMTSRKHHVRFSSFQALSLILFPTRHMHFFSCLLFHSIVLFLMHIHPRYLSFRSIQPTNISSLHSVCCWTRW